MVYPVSCPSAHTYDHIFERSTSTQSQPMLWTSIVLRPSWFCPLGVVRCICRFRLHGLTPVNQLSCCQFQRARFFLIDHHCRWNVQPITFLECTYSRALCSDFLGLARQLSTWGFRWLLRWSAYAASRGLWSLLDLCSALFVVWTLVVGLSRAMELDASGISG